MNWLPMKQAEHVVGCHRLYKGKLLKETCRLFDGLVGPSFEIGAETALWHCPVNGAMRQYVRLWLRAIATSRISD